MREKSKKGKKVWQRKAVEKVAGSLGSVGGTPDGNIFSKDQIKGARSTMPIEVSAKTNEVAEGVLMNYHTVKDSSVVMKNGVVPSPTVETISLNGGEAILDR